MATKHTLTGNIFDLAGATFGSKAVSLHVVTNLGQGALVDKTTNAIHLGGKVADVNESTGEFTVDLIDTSATDLNVPAGEAQYEVRATFIDAGTRQRQTWYSGWFGLTADSNLADITTDVSPLAVSSASTYALEAKAYRDEAEVITGLTGEDDAVALLVNTPGSDTASALSATYARHMVVDANHPSTGIKADGVTDDAAAWNTLVAAQDPGTVITFTGRSKLGSAIIWKTGVSLVGQGWGNSVLAPTHATNYFAAIKYTPAEGASTTNPLEDCTFRDFEVDGSGIAGTAANIGAKAIFAQYLRRCQFLNLYLHDTGATALGTDYMPECLIDGVIVERAGRNWDGAAGGHAGIGIGMGAWEHEPVTIVNSHAIDCGHWGIFVEYQSGEAFRSKGARIINCTARGTEGVGIGDRGCAETLIQGCHVSDSGSDGIQISYGAHSGQVLDNIVTDNTGDGIGFETDSGDGWRIAGNKVGRNVRRGIYFDGSTGTYSNHVIENNECWGNTFQGILVDTAISAAGLWRNGVIRGNRCYNNGQGGTEADGIKLEADMLGVVVAGNRCYDDQAVKTQTVGIRLSASATYELTDVQIIDNHLIGNSSAGMTLGSVVRTRVDVRRNAGYVTENRGASQINDTGSTVTVLHGLAAAPTSVVVTPEGANEALWVTTKGASGFIVNRAGTTGARPFSWQAEV